MKDPDVRLVLDTSAILAYAGTSIHVGETIAEVVDEFGKIGVPTACLAEASRLVEPKLSDGIALLTHHPACVILPALEEDWTAESGWPAAPTTDGARVTGNCLFGGAATGVEESRDPVAATPDEVR